MDLFFIGVHVHVWTRGVSSWEHYGQAGNALREAWRSVGCAVSGEDDDGGPPIHLPTLLGPDVPQNRHNLRSELGYERTCWVTRTTASTKA